MNNAPSISAKARELGAASLEKVSYKSTVRHVCCSGGQRLEMRTLDMVDYDRYTRYVLCPHCRRMFYATRDRAVTVRQFVYETKRHA